MQEEGGSARGEHCNGQSAQLHCVSALFGAATLIVKMPAKHVVNGVDRCNGQQVSSTPKESLQGSDFTGCPGTFASLATKRLEKPESSGQALKSFGRVPGLPRTKGACP